MDKGESTRKNMLKAFNSWLVRVFIKPVNEDYKAKASQARNPGKIALSFITFILAAAIICSLVFSSIVSIIETRENAKEQENATTTITSGTSTGTGESKSTVTKTTTDTKTTTTSADGTTKVEESYKEETVTKPESSNASSTSPKTLTELITSAFMKKGLMTIIFNHMLGLLGLFIIHHLLLLWMGDIKRFKFGTLEVEKNTTEKGVISALNQVNLKLDIVKSWTTKSSTYQLNAFTKNITMVREYLELILEFMKNDYLSIFQVHFDYDIFPVSQANKKKYPFAIKRALQVLDQDPKAMIINKEIPESSLHSNHLIYKIMVEEINNVGEPYNEEYAIVLSSFRNEFDEYDILVLEALSNLMNITYQRDYYTSELLISDQLVAENAEVMKKLKDMQVELERNRMHSSENY
jgi:hypothetical protein